MRTKLDWAAVGRSARATAPFSLPLLGLLLVALVVMPLATRAAAARSRAPIPASSARSVHAPFEAGECGTCHARSTGPDPGPLIRTQPGLCLDCHDDLPSRIRVPGHEPRRRDDCTSCHSPHNSTKPKLLL